VSRRRAPRPAAEALRAALGRAAPKTRLAALQAAWSETVGERVAAAAQPVAERDGAVVVECSDPVWAEELDLMQEQLLERLRGRLGEQAPQALRFRAKESPDSAHF
jgi:predicted nucleic acid-binding Zn ribbon protein